MYWRQAAEKSEYKLAYRRKADGAITFIHASGFACRTNGEEGLVRIKKAARIDEFKDYQPIEDHQNWETCVRQFKVLVGTYQVDLTVSEEPLPKSDGLLSRLSEAEDLKDDLCHLVPDLETEGFNENTITLLNTVIEKATRLLGLL